MTDMVEEYLGDEKFFNHKGYITYNSMNFNRIS